MGTMKVVGGLDSGFVTTKFNDILAWSRKWSLFQYPFVTACCGMEFMSVAGPRYDLSRFGAEAPRFSPRQADLLWVVGTVSQRQAPALRRIYEQMADPKWVLAFGTCASCGGFYDNYATVPGIDKVIPVDIYVPGCPPRPEAVLDGLMLLQEKIQTGAKGPLVVPPAEVPRLAQLRAKNTSTVVMGTERLRLQANGQDELVEHQRSLLHSEPGLVNAELESAQSHPGEGRPREDEADR